MTDCAAAWSLEGEAAVAFTCLMTDEARKFLVPRMWKAVGRSLRCRRRSDCEVKRGRARRIECISHRIAARWRRDRLGARERQSDFARSANASRCEDLLDLCHPRAPESLGRIEWKRRLELAARANTQVTAFAVACIDLCRVRPVASEALRCNALVTRAYMEGLVAPVGMTPRCLARFRGDCRCLLLVRIVAHAALPRVRILPRVKIGKDFLHVMAAKAL